MRSTTNNKAICWQMALGVDHAGAQWLPLMSISSSFTKRLPLLNL